MRKATTDAHLDCVFVKKLFYTDPRFYKSQQNSIELVTRPTGVQFGHAGASASGEKETASAKNRALREAGAIVPDNFDLLGVKIGEVYGALVKKGDIVPQPETPPPPGLVTTILFL